MENRQVEYKVILEEILNRWSPRAFDSNIKLEKDEIMGLIEAAHYAPSCFNEQPWRFIIANNEELFEKVLNTLTKPNQEWAKNASSLLVILSKKSFTQNDKENRWHLFDAGTAWGYLSLEAQKRRIITHAMGGFNQSLLRETLNISDEYSIITVVALGYYGDKSQLSDELLNKEKPSPRKAVDEVVLPL